jgi:hypothetical protein
MLIEIFVMYHHLTIAFNLGFGQTACAGIGLTGSKSGQFDIQQFSTDQFNIKFNQIHTH